MAGKFNVHHDIFTKLETYIRNVKVNVYAYNEARVVCSLFH